MSIKRLINTALEHFGYEFRRISDPYPVQRLLIRNEKPIIFDVGAHEGETARKYRDLFPSAVVHCFEPFPKSLAVLNRVTADDEGMIAHEVAVWDDDALLDLNVNVSSATNSLLATDPRARAYEGAALLETKDTIKVRAVKLDAFCAAHGIRHIDILKLDIQGSEMRALKGASAILGRHDISLIYSEVILAPMYEGQGTFQGYFDLLNATGYELLDFYNPVRVFRQLVQTDVIFISSELAGLLEERLESRA